MESLVIRTESRTLTSVPFSQSQEIIHAAVAPRLDAGIPLRFIVLKPRQIFSSTYWMKLMFTHTIANTGVHSLVIAQDVPTAHELLDMGKRFNDHLPMPALVPSRATELVYPFPGGVSKLRIQSAKMTGRGRGANWTCVVASEVPYWPNPEIAVGVRQAVPDLPDTLWVEESTANGKSGLGTQFYQHWLTATTGDSDLVPIFISWVSMYKYRRSVGVPPDDWDTYEKRLADTFGGPRGLEYPAPLVRDPVNMSVIARQLAWRRWAIKNKTKNSSDIFDQEYPLTPEVAFIASGIPAFDPHALLAQHANVTEPKLRGLMRRGRFEVQPRGSIRLWAEPRPDHHYVIGADTAEGLDAEGGSSTDARDYAAAQILDMRTLEQVGSVHGYIAPWDFADVLNQVGRWFNDALLAIEINNHGHTVQDRLLREFYYPNLHRWRGKPDRALNAQVNRRLYGWETNSYSRPLMIDAGRRVINDRERSPLVLHEAKLLEELGNFSLMDSGKYEAEYGHDDRCIALLIALRSREENYVEARLSANVPEAELDLRRVRVVDHRAVRHYSDTGYPQGTAKDFGTGRLFRRATDAVTSYLQL